MESSWIEWVGVGVMVLVMAPFTLILLSALRRLQDLREEVVVLKVRSETATEARERIQDQQRQDNAWQREEMARQNRLLVNLTGILEAAEVRQVEDDLQGLWANAPDILQPDEPEELPRTRYDRLTDGKDFGE
jgi:hypothetical protein